LPLQLANQIAAGEVVERPASVVKELLENSLDAGAERIEVSISKGGLLEIRVRDDGGGIPRQELQLAMSRHATSKIDSLAELENIHSMGFRGEALASIGSVSQLRLSSRCADEEQAWQIHYQADGHATPQPASHPTGTSVVVQDLFYNTPARRKFLRSERTEFRYADEVFRRLALSRFDVAMSLSHNGRTVHQLSTARSDNTRAGRVNKLCGKAFMDSAVQLELAASGLKLWGWLSTPGFSRSQNDLQHFFVNGRSIRDRLINHAIRQAYEDMLPPGRYPGLVLYLELAPALVDVNVHPTKHEVRFREARQVHDFIYSSLRKALGQGHSQHAMLAEAYIAEQAQDYKSVARPAAVSAQSYPSTRTALQRQQLQQHSILGRPLAMLHGQFILAEDDSGLVMVDVLRAQQKIALRRLKDSFNDGGIIAQPLLLPMNLNLTETQANTAERFQATLQRLGIEFSRTGPQSLMLRMFPALLRDADKPAVLVELIRQLAGLPDTEASQAWSDLMAAMAKQAAQTSTTAWSVQQMDGFLDQLVELNDPSLWSSISLEQMRSLINPVRSTY